MTEDTDFRCPKCNKRPDDAYKAGDVWDFDPKWDPCPNCGKDLRGETK